MELKKLDSMLKKIYSAHGDEFRKLHNRYERLFTEFNSKFTEKDVHLFSTPGRTEIGGNHTDHNHGRVLAASINLDTIAEAAVNHSDIVTMYSEGYTEPFVVDLSQLDIVPHEKGTTSALIRGIAARFRQLGLNIGGFNAAVTSDVLPGSGLSSSASIEVLIGTICNHLFNEGNIELETIALIGQYAENVYFGKPCGLMDQITCAVGGIVTIDFKNPEQPAVEKINFDFNSQNYSLLVVDTGGTHADITDDYASIPREMKSVANVLGSSVCREIRLEDLITRMKELRLKVGDRAILRAFHFLSDNERVVQQVNALKQGDFPKFLSLVNESGNSSFMWLQNIYSIKNIRQQGLALALALTEKYITDINAGACRVHGGGFAGTIQVFLPNEAVHDYFKLMESIFGNGSVLVLNIRPLGSLHLNQFI